MLPPPPAVAWATVLAFLSDEWLAAMDEALAAHASTRPPTSGPLVVRQQVIGERPYVMWFDGARAGVRADPPPPSTPADVTFTCDRDTAVAIATGKERAQAAFLAGRLRLGGDSRALMTNAAVLSDLDDAFAAVRARTDFSA
jgi:putative sterol carrier protein